VIDQRLSLAREARRKALHLSSSVVPVAYALGVSRSVLGAIVVAACAVAIAVELARAYHAPTRARFHSLVGGLLRQHEREGWVGATWMLLSYASVIWLAPRGIAIASMWAVAVGDAFAALVGRGLGFGRVRGSAKSLSGSAACFAGVVVGAFWIAHLTTAESLVAGLAAAVAEWPEHVVDDNVRIAAAVTGGILLCRIAFS
jgi:dolichol kinase